ncbi:Clavaminate synthase-like protein [Paraphaeosphaeria sporulosa]|uniref:Clavaminate synthase-like protein n=1 Tax=Paraphaeosphaeria sporulosa TaxID=1460663 RepID=A0A177C8D7_9PLEO|nr:Clavaminate synthase-like protein [Paraphaeosphaeria sporulosa]OAG03119.1 Clavaminate synthase-like protein [Paraphaeosphaeria sporulosa]
MPHSERTASPPADASAALPSFPDNVPTAPLLRISLAKLLRNDADEYERCWRACCELGFFYVDLQTEDGTGEALLEEVGQLFEVMKDFFGLPVEEKTKYDFADQGSYFGYKGYGKGIVDGKGTRDRNEFYNISKDDILNLSPPLPCPDLLNPHRPLFESYIRASHNLCMLFASLVSSRLSLNPQTRASGGLSALHDLSAQSGDQIRFVKAPPQPHSSAAVALGEHTDFGKYTLSLLRDDSIQPSRRTPSAPPTVHRANAAFIVCAVLGCRKGALPGRVDFSGGRLRSNIHRVVPPPGEQWQVDRYSLVYFCRPVNDVVLKTLVEGEELGEEEEVSAKEWILRRALGRRREDGWKESAGTEGKYGIDIWSRAPSLKGTCENYFETLSIRQGLHFLEEVRYKQGLGRWNLLEIMFGRGSRNDLETPPPLSCSLPHHLDLRPRSHFSGPERRPTRHVEASRVVSE